MGSRASRVGLQGHASPGQKRHRTHLRRHRHYEPSLGTSVHVQQQLAISTCALKRAA